MHVPCKLWIIDRIIITLSQCKILKTCYKSFQSDYLKVQQNCNLSHLVISSTLSFHLSSYCVLMETGSWPMDLMENFDLLIIISLKSVLFCWLISISVFNIQQCILCLQLDINTVAAGGGSRLFFRAGLFVVGPESASAHPGPVCYRKGKTKPKDNQSLYFRDLSKVISEFLLLFCRWSISCNWC